MKLGLHREEWEQSLFFAQFRRWQRFQHSHPFWWLLCLSLGTLGLTKWVAQFDFPLTRMPPIFYPSTPTVYYWTCLQGVGLVYLLLAASTVCGRVFGKKHRGLWLLSLAVAYQLYTEAALSDFVKHSRLQTRPHPILGYELFPDDPNWGTDDRGLRGATIERSANRPYNVLVLGDSNVFGTDSRFPWSEPLRLALQARLPERSVQVWNGAVPGYSIVTCNRAYRLKYRKLKLKLLIVSTFMDISLGPTRELEALPWTRSSELRMYFYRSFNYMVLRKLLFHARDHSNSSPPKNQRRLSDAEVLQGYRDLATACSEDHVVLVVIGPPIQDPVMAADVHTLMTTASLESSIHFVDAQADFKKDPGFVSYFANGHNVHLNHHGNTRLARLIMEHLKEWHLLEEGQGDPPLPY